MRMCACVCVLISIRSIVDHTHHKYASCLSVFGFKGKEKEEGKGEDEAWQNDKNRYCLTNG